MTTETRTHTPGPWVARESDPEGDWRHSMWVDGASSVPVADVRGYHDGSDHANARLIAASPDLLRACERLLGEIDGDIPRTACAETEDMLRAAIARARGEGEG